MEIGGPCRMFRMVLKIAEGVRIRRLQRQTIS